MRGDRRGDILTLTAVSLVTPVGAVKLSVTDSSQWDALPVPTEEVIGGAGGCGQASLRAG